MAVVMNAALFIRTLTVEEGGWLCSWQCFLLSLCVQIQIQETHTKGPEPLNPVLWLTQTLFVDLNFPTALDTVVKSCQWCSLWESCEKAFCHCFVCRFLQKHIELYFDHFNKAGLIFFTGSTGCLL